MTTFQSQAVPFSDKFMALVLLVFCSPVLLVRAVKHSLGLSSEFGRSTYYKDLYSKVSLIAYSGGAKRKAPLLMSVVKGEIALVGSRLIATAEVADLEELEYAEAHFACMPGVFSLFESRLAAGHDFLSEAECNLEYLENKGVKQSMKIVIKTLLISAFYRNAEALNDVAKFNVLGVGIDNLSMREALDSINDAIVASARKTVFFANAHTLNLSYENAEFRDILNGVDTLLPDGSGIEIACLQQGVRRKGNINGTDMLPLLCEELAASGHSIYMLGGEEGIAQTAAHNLTMRTPALQVAGTRNGFFDQQNCADVIAEINAAKPSILLVGMGQPIQERWVAANRDLLHVPVVMAVGGLFDFYAEKVSRAPLWLRELGLEWIWRLMQEPSRMWKRYIIGNPLFLIRLKRAARAE